MAAVQARIQVCRSAATYNQPPEEHPTTALHNIYILYSTIEHKRGIIISHRPAHTKCVLFGLCAALARAKCCTWLSVKVHIAYKRRAMKVAGARRNNALFQCFAPFRCTHIITCGSVELFLRCNVMRLTTLEKREYCVKLVYG